VSFVGLLFRLLIGFVGSFITFCVLCVASKVCVLGGKLE
jgi:hypothetical protein